MPTINGKQGYAITIGSFVQPSIGATVAVTFSQGGIVPGVGAVLSSDAGVYSVESSTLIRLLEVRGASPGATVSAGHKLGFAGQRGRSGLIFNTEAILSVPASSTSTLESTLVSVTFTAPASGMVMLFGMGTISYAANNGELEVYLDVSGVAGARVPNMIRGSSAVPREAFSPTLLVSGLTPSASYTARVRWRSITTGTPRVCNPTTDTKQAARLTVFDIN